MPADLPKPTSRFLGLLRLAPTASAIVLAMSLIVGGCSKSSSAPAADGDNSQETSDNYVNLLLLHDGGKESWIAECTAAFNTTQPKSNLSRTIRVKAVAVGTIDSLDGILNGNLQPQLLSPASTSLIDYINTQARARDGRNLLGPVRSLARSPMVVAMWRPMAEALQTAGPSAKPIGWAHLAAMAQEDNAWATTGHAEWGPFKYTHPNANACDCGLLAVICQTSGVAGKWDELTTREMVSNKLRAGLGALESRAPWYGPTATEVARGMIAAGPANLSATAVFENNMIEANLNNPAAHLVAIYPKEGTLQADHPIGIVQRGWTSDEQRQAAKTFIDFLCAQPQQDKAMRWGLRPADPTAPLAAPLDAAHGVDPIQPLNISASPPRFNDALNIWRKTKRHANIVFAIDCSSGMAAQDRIANARIAAIQFVDMLDDDANLSILEFNADLRWGIKDMSMSSKSAADEPPGRPMARLALSALYADGTSRLNEAVDVAVEHLQEPATGDNFPILIVLANSRDGSNMKFGQLMDKLHDTLLQQPIHIYTIACGPGADNNLKRLAGEGHGKFYEAGPDDMRRILGDIASRF